MKFQRLKLAQIEFHPRHDEIDRVRGTRVGQSCIHNKGSPGCTCCCQLKPNKSLRREIMTFSPGYNLLYCNSPSLSLQAFQFYVRTLAETKSISADRHAQYLFLSL